MKKYTKFLFFVLIVFTSLSLGKKVSAAGTYADEGTGFYAPTTPPVYAAEGIAFYAYDPTATQPSGTVTVYRYYNSSNGDHFYTTDNTQTYAGYSSEGTGFYAYSTQVSGTLPVYRFYNSSNGKHFYTASAAEDASLLNNPQWGFVSEGIAFYAYDPAATQPSGTLPVYRFYNATTGDHFYTASQSEANSITLSPVYRFYNSSGHHFYTASASENTIVSNTSQSGYAPEGIAFYAYSTQVSGTSPVYRFYNSSTGDHFYTISSDEANSLTSNPSSGYVSEGIAFYAYTTQVSGTSPVYRLFNSTTNDHFYTASVAERTQLLTSPLGPQISVGLWEYDKSDISSSPFEITADEPYNIVNSSGTIIGQVAGDNMTKVEYDSSGNLKIYDSITSTDSNTSVSFVATNGDPGIIFNTNRSDSGSSYTHYRGSIKLQYYHGTDIYGGTSSTVSQVWVINTLPLEEYVWGMGETTGTGPDEHTKVMATIFRTYGFWYIKYATKYAPYGFQIRSDSGSQVYWGEDWESNYPNIKKNAQATRGIFATYDSDVALTPYSSWSDGKTRSFKDVWGSSDYPWCKSVSDPYGKNTSMTTAQLQAAGNAMVGLIAHGSLELAGSDHNWAYNKILKYYYTGISLPTNY